MARIAGINIPMNKHVCIGLTQIFGIGRSRALADLRGRGHRLRRTKVKDLTEAEVARSARSSPSARSRATCAAKCR